MTRTDIGTTHIDATTGSGLAEILRREELLQIHQPEIEITNLNFQTDVTWEPEPIYSHEANLAR